MGSNSLIDIYNKSDKRIKDKFELELSTCFDQCNGQLNPPIIKIDSKYYEEMNPEKFQKLLNTYCSRGEKNG